MLNKVIDTLNTAIKPNSSRCMRMRYFEHSCNYCIKVCKNNAITIDDVVLINQAQCSNCGLCAVACPAGCFDDAEMFYYTLSELKKVSLAQITPILGCLANLNQKAHARLPCLGHLSSVHLMFLYAVMSVRLNISACEGCPNEHAIKELLNSSTEVATVFADFNDKVILVKRKEDLKYSDIAFDRRGFFKALREKTLMKTSTVLLKDKPSVTTSYSQKSLPLKLELLNKLVALSDEIPKRFFYTLHISDKCQACQGCIGMCPTGALSLQAEGDALDILFFSPHCTGCGLCSSFCPEQAITISLGATVSYVTKPLNFQIS